MSTRADAVVLVIRSGHTTKPALRRARDILLQVNARGLRRVSERRRSKFARLLLSLRISGKIRTRVLPRGRIEGGGSGL